jgi:hypothetical protein
VKHSRRYAARSIYRHLKAGIGYAGGNATGTSSITAGFYGELGADYNASENISLNANYKIGSSGFVNLGVGYRF